MSGELLIAASAGEVRAARIEDGVLVDLIVERQTRASLLGNIYLGRVRRMVPALSAAFVDIGLARDGFLPVGTKRPGDGSAESEAEPSAPLPDFAEGEAICVQVTRDANRTKGPQLSRRLSLAGGRLVLLPGGQRVAVSRLIEDETERARLAAAVSGVVQQGDGFVVRTAAEAASADDLIREAEYLHCRWREIETVRAAAAAPALLHREPDALERVLRDHALSGVAAVRIEGTAAYARARDFCRRFAADLESRLSLHRRPSPLFDANGIENAIDEALGTRVPLPSGGGIVIETTEAFSAIDVNSGSLTYPVAQGEVALRTNLEAAVEVARQVRLRNLGGLIVIDFISMDSDADWHEVLDKLARQLARDRNPSRLFGRTAAGLVELTRRRQRISIAEALTEPCVTCRGSGRVPTAETVAHATLGRLQREARTAPAGALVVSAAPDVLTALESIWEGGLAALESTLGRRILLQTVAGTPRECVDLHVA